MDLFGAQPDHAGSIEMLKLPGIIILMLKGLPSDASGLPVVDHFALVGRDLAATQKKLAAADIRIGDGSIATFPDGVRVELLEDKSLGVPVAFHHFHIFCNDVESTRAWYAKVFGSTAFPAGSGFRGGRNALHRAAKPGAEQRACNRSHKFRGQRAGGVLQEAGIACRSVRLPSGAVRLPVFE
jgi:hypothetical protein